MDRATLRSLQQPLKQRYLQQPAEGTIRLSANGTIGAQNLSCSVQTGQAIVAAGLHPSTGGDGTLACSGDLLLQALAACAGVTLAAVATNRGFMIQGNIQATGELDVRGTLGIDPQVPVGFRSITLSLELQSDLSVELVTDLVQTTEKYCVVLQTLRSVLPIEVESSNTSA
ncbi:peroxiredoxin [Arthrobacter sp. MYb227]|nr:peroxiredoxin [Arthrobacter sp. MYb227]